MRLAPLPMLFVQDLSKVAHHSGESSRTTHGAPETVDACRLFGVMLALALRGESNEDLLFRSHSSILPGQELTPSIADIAAGTYRTKRREEIRGTGYVVTSLEAALWCFLHTDSYSDAVLCAANLGDDADTTAAICGQIAGAAYGVDSIPNRWLAQLAKGRVIEGIAKQLFEQRESI